MPDPGKRMILANEPGTRERWYSETWNTPMPDPQALAPDTDLAALRTSITEANIDDAILAKRLRAHKESLAYLEPALMDWDDRLKATATIIRAALTTHEDIVHRKAAALEAMKLELSTIPSALPRAFELNSLINKEGTVVSASTAACALLRERTDALQQRLTANTAYGALVETEIAAVTSDLREVDKRMQIARYKERQNSPPTTQPKKQKTENEDSIVLDTLGTHWPLAKPEGQSKGIKYTDPHQDRPLFQRSMGLHQQGTGDWERLVTDKQYLQTATVAYMSQYSVNNPVLMTHEVHLHFTCFDAPQASNLELLAHLNTIGLEYSQPPQWKPGKVKKIIASVHTMTELLWQYLLQAAICKDGIAMAIAMDKHQEEDAQDFFCHGALSRFGRETLTAADIPNKVQSNLRDKDIHVKIRPRESEHWYRALLINGMVELCFRTADDMKRYEELPITEKPFLVTTTGSTKRMLGAVSSTGKEASLAPLGRYKLDLLFIPLETSLTKIETLLKEGDIRWSGMERHAMGKGADGAPTTSKVTIGFDEEPDMARCSQAVYGTFRPEIKRRGELLCSIQYDVPRHHCYKCYYPDKPKESYGHNGKDCTKETVCDVCHEPHATTGCGWIQEKKAVVQHRHDIIPESVYRARNAARDAAFIQQGAQWGSSAGSMYGGSQAGGPAWGNPSEVGSVIYPGDSPTQPSRTMQRVVPYREDSPMGYRGPPSPVRTAEDVFTPRSAGHDWTTSGYVPTQADYERIRSTSRQGRAATGADDRYTDTPAHSPGQCPPQPRR